MIQDRNKIENSVYSIKKISKFDVSFCSEIEKKSKVNLNLCWQCHTCSSGCSFANLMDFMPNQVIRSIQLGEKRAVLEISTIWLCVDCNTCLSECPMAIDIPAVMSVLRETAIEENVKIAASVYDTYLFHKDFSNSIKRYGRAYKLGIILTYKFRKFQFLRDGRVGFKMLMKRKLNIIPSRIRNICEVKKLFI